MARGLSTKCLDPKRRIDPLVRKERGMKRHILGLIVAMALATPLVAQQQQTPPPQTPPDQQQKEKPSPKDITLTGCVVQGSQPTIFLLDNARVNPQDPNEKGRTYFIVESAQDLNVKSHLDHEVTLSG